jgi:DNA-binding FadR family transcriptional regulator
MNHHERMRHVAYVEQELERMIARGEVHPSGTLPPENVLARQYGVARGTLREALLRLVTRGLVVRQQGRQARVVAVEHATSLENLGMVRHALGSRQTVWRHLLVGYFELKRETTVELLVHGCARGSESDLERLGMACFVLRDKARWDQGTREWVEHEFELLRVAALVGNRPGHYLLVQSLERAFQGMAEALRPHLEPEAVRHWSEQALSWLGERDVEALRKELPPLLRACDERVLGSLWPVPV